MSAPDASAPSQLTEHEIQLRQKWLQFESIKDSDIEQIEEILNESVDDLMDSMYGHFLSFEQTRVFFPGPHVLQRAMSAQKQYFLRLASGLYDWQYVSDRLKVGSTHHRIELDPKWYFGAYSHAISWLLPKFLTDEKVGSVIALLKLIFFDIGLAIESYIGAKELSIIQQRDAIRELETEKRVTRGILESAPIGIVTLDENFNCVACNEEFAHILERANAQEVVGNSLFQLTPYLANQTFLAVKQTGNPSQSSAEALNFTQEKSSEIAYWDWAVWPTKTSDASVNGFVAMFSNATDRVLLQQQREDFVATLTHDLKTPIAATNRAVKLILDGDFGQINAGQKEILETILQSNTTLYSLVETLLEVYRFDSGVKELECREANIAALITQLVTEIMPLANERNVQLNAVLPIGSTDILCDPDEIRRVIQNLIDNSLKFTPAGGAAIVKMTQDEVSTTVSVSDTGKGIPPENMPKLFQRFWQAGSSGRYYASTGLGLYLTRKIIEGHGGKVWCESELGQGSNFIFTIPNR